MSTMSVEREGREWVHAELPEGIAGRPGYQLGCRCSGCTEANREYMRQYRARRQHETTRSDGTLEFHTHKGQPSKRTARRWGCTHSECLRRAGLRLSEEGIVVDAVTGIVDATFGAVPGPLAA